MLRNKIKSADSILAPKVSSNFYKDPYHPNGQLVYQLRNKVKTWFGMRNIENEFVDYKSHKINAQIQDIYSDLHTAYKKGDKVILQRSLSQNMLEFVKDLLRERRPNPFYRSISKVQCVSARIYQENEHLLPEDQWAQMTFKFDMLNHEEQPITQYNVFERNLADKMSYFDWKMSYMFDR